MRGSAGSSIVKVLSWPASPRRATALASARRLRSGSAERIGRVYYAPEPRAPWDENLVRPLGFVCGAPAPLCIDYTETKQRIVYRGSVVTTSQLRKFCGLYPRFTRSARRVQ